MWSCTIRKVICLVTTSHFQLTFLYNLQWNLLALSLDKLSLVLHAYSFLRHPFKKLDFTSMWCIAHHWVADTTTIWLVASQSFVCFLLYSPVRKPFKISDFTSMWCIGHRWVADTTTIARTFLILVRKNDSQNWLLALIPLCAFSSILRWESCYSISLSIHQVILTMV